MHTHLMRCEAEASVVNQHKMCPSAFMLLISQVSESNLKSIMMAASWIYILLTYSYTHNNLKCAGLLCKCSILNETKTMR